MKIATLFSCVSLIFASSLVAQSSGAPASLVPDAFASARNAFVTSGGVSAVTGKSRLVADIVYGSFTQQMGAWGHYRLVTATKGADLALNIAVRSEVADVTGGSSLNRAYLELEVHEPGSNVLLWRLDEPLAGAFREKTFRNNVDAAVGKLIDDLKHLSAGHLPDSQD